MEDSMNPEVPSRRLRVVRLERTCLMCARVAKPADVVCSACGSRSFLTDTDGTPARIPEEPNQRLFDLGMARRGRPPKWLVRERQRESDRLERSA